MEIPTQYLSVMSGGKEIDIAYRQYLTAKHRPGFMFWSGLGGDMHGRKGSHILQYCLRHDLNCLLFDYSGHGQSQGDYLQQNMTNWRQEGWQLLQNFVHNENTILIASSIGAWLSLLLLDAKLKTKISGLIWLAPAINFVLDFVKNLNNEQKQDLEVKGYCEYHRAIISRHLLEDAARKIITNQQLQAIDIPVTIIHGYEDVVVNYSNSLILIEKLSNAPQRDLNLLPHTDHRMRDQSSMRNLTSAMTKMSLMHS